MIISVFAAVKAVEKVATWLQGQPPPFAAVKAVEKCLSERAVQEALFAAVKAVEKRVRSIANGRV